MKVVIITDAWSPQANGVATTYSHTMHHLENLGCKVDIIEPGQFKTMANPTYPEIRLVLNPRKHLCRLLDQLRPDAVHIATEGPLGLAARVLCKHQNHQFSTSFHTRFPEYVKKRCFYPLRWSEYYMKWFHNPAKTVMYSTQHLIPVLQGYQLTNLKEWRRGVDHELFRPMTKTLDLPRPILLYVGRVAIEKNLTAFLDLDISGTKIVVGDGPLLSAYKKRYPQTIFVGRQLGAELVLYYSSADVFVFPSLTDTFGLVMLEALACGTPVAAFPVTAPLDVISNPRIGALHHNLKTAIQQALLCKREHCREFSLDFTWERATRQFLDNLVPFT